MLGGVFFWSLCWSVYFLHILPSGMASLDQQHIVVPWSPWGLDKSYRECKGAQNRAMHISIGFQALRGCGFPLWPCSRLVSLDYWMECLQLEGIGSGDPFRNSAEVTHALPHRMCVPIFLRGWFLIIGNQGLCWYLPGTFSCYSLISQ